MRPDLRSHEITSKDVWEARRRFMKGALAGAGVLALGPLLARGAEEGPARPRLEGRPSPLSTGEKKTPYEDVTTYNNFYELGTSKEAPARNARRLHTDPWSISVDGECLRPGRVGVEDLLDRPALEERIYRLRCVEGWSMVIPWIGLPLSKVLARFQPSSHAKYVAFETLLDPERLPGQRRPVLEWPYREGLRLDEAMHPLTLLAFGLYGEVLPPQNGAPLRLVVPWKYGFKSIKSLVGIRFTRAQPPTAWNVSAPSEYGFFANVNPEVDHPRWSQKTERRLGEWRRRPTLPFNGYGDQVASLYTGLDLRRWY